MADSLRVRRIFEFIESLSIPSGIGKGEPFRLRGWQRSFIRDVYRERNGKRIVRRAILSMGRKNGKGLALDTPIPTPRGWKRLEEIEAGDEVYGSDGKPTRVSFASQIHSGLRCWLITFSDGSSVVADENHQWVTRHRYQPWMKYLKRRTGNGTREVESVVTTPQIADSVKVPSQSGKNESNHKLACAPAILSTDVELPIDPYVLGLWLGDGSSYGAQITCGERDLDVFVREIEGALGHEVRISRSLNRAATISLSDGVKNRTKDCVKKRLRQFGLLNNKHIPRIYFSSGTGQRWRLLQGLMDSDGTVTRCSGKTTPRCSFTTTTVELANGVWRLARSLGLKATIHERQAKLGGRVIGPKFDVAFSASIDDPVFQLPRKQQLLPRVLGKRSRTVTITSCQEVDSVDTRCLSVAAKDEMFLCGYGCIPTHNTMLTAALSLVHLIGPEAEPNGRIYSAANDNAQAALIFEYMEQLIKVEPLLMEHLDVIPSTKTIRAVGDGSTYRALSAEAGTKYGLNPTMVIYDELSQAKDTKLYDALATSMGARQEPLFIIISTQSADPQHILSQLIDAGLRGDDPSTYCRIYTVPEQGNAGEDDHLTNERKWKLANPALGDFRDLEEMRISAKEAQRIPTREAAFRNLYLNQRINAESPLIPRQEWMACKGSPPVTPNTPLYLGLDLSGKTDLTALVGVTAGATDAVRAWFWKPQESLAEHEKRDRVPYTVWKAQGILETTPGKAIQYDWVAARLAQLAKEYRIAGLAFDRWRIDDLLSALGKIGVEVYVDTSRPPEPTGDVAADARERQKYEAQGRVRAGALRMVPWGQGFKDMTQAIEALEVSVLQRNLIHDGNPILTWNASNAIAVSDPAGGRKLDKSRSRFRIDGMVALAMALGLKSRDLQQEAGKSVYHSRGVMVL